MGVVVMGVVVVVMVVAMVVAGMGLCRGHAAGSHVIAANPIPCGTGAA
jgi:hypothetical protein